MISAINICEGEIILILFMTSGTNKMNGRTKSKMLTSLYSFVFTIDFKEKKKKKLTQPLFDVLSIFEQGHFTIL